MSGSGGGEVRIWSEDVVIPTYGVGEPDRNPMFLDRRVYQGSSGRVYPYPVIDRIADERTDRVHRVVLLENRYLKLMVMPEYGGRIQYAYDKTNGYGFIYHNRVIKPALVGLAGPWLSGGIEFNWPQHHRPGTFCPVDHTITTKPDGSMTLWLSEIEPMFHMKGTVGLTLYPGRAYLEVAVRLFNRTPLPQSFHLWTNPAVPVNDQYQSVFPPDVRAVYDHGKRDVSAFPIARGEYYKVDYSRGVDISWYKNLPVPTSYMEASSQYDFLGGYDHGRRAGVLHVADHHVVPGKKQWVWGCGEFGKGWDRNLTDEDGPYAELMCGVFADNQPDFSWLQPFEEKEVRQYFMPYKGIGYVRNATVEGAVNLEIERGTARVGVYVTSERPGATVRLRRGPDVLWERREDLDPEYPLITEFTLEAKPRGADLRLEVLSAEGRELVAYTPEPAGRGTVPEPARAIPAPRELPTGEALYLAGLHLEQYRHATREPEEYYREALRREPADARNNNALGLLLLRRGRFALSERFFRAAIASLSRHNANPYDGEPWYNLGLSLRYQGRGDEAYDAFFKATWNGAWRDAGYFQLAQLSAVRGDLARALEFVDASLERNGSNQRAMHLKAVLLRRLGRAEDAARLVEAAIARDPLDFGTRNERVLLMRENGRAEEAGREVAALLTLMRRDPSTHMEIAADYAGAGRFDEALDLLGRIVGDPATDSLRNLTPVVLYFMGYYAAEGGDRSAAAEFYAQGAGASPERCFPNSIESIVVLQAAMEFNPRDAVAAYCLGNLWFDKRQYDDAIGCWEKCRRSAPKFATVHRNLAIAWYNRRREPAKARRLLERAYTLDPNDARVLFELDLLRKRLGVDPRRRLAFLHARARLVAARDDLTLQTVTLLNSLGHHEEALRILSGRQFHPWEGGEGKVTGQYVGALLELAKRRLREGRAGEAVGLLERARVYPENLGEGRLHGAREDDILFYLGVAHERAGDPGAARAMWEEASVGGGTVRPAVYYNDQKPEAVFYQGLALMKLGKKAHAGRCFEALVRYARRHLNDDVTLDYFAVSLPEFMVFDDDLSLRHRINCRYLLGLGYLGLGRRAGAAREFQAILKLDPSHQPARLHLRACEGWELLHGPGPVRGAERAPTGRGTVVGGGGRRAPARSKR